MVPLTCWCAPKRSPSGLRPRPVTTAAVVDRSFFGADQLVRVRLADGTALTSRRPGYVHWYPGDVVAVWVEGPVTALAAEPL